MIFVPRLSANRSFCTDLDRSPFHKFKFSAILIISHTQWAQASIDRYAQGFPEATFLKPAPLPSERLYIEHA
jgi:hypothetical protein